jgi:hypothetical protein
LGDFERYFWYKYDGKERDCTRELAKFLTRQEKEAYLAVGGPSIKIGEMKQSLLRWYRSYYSGWTERNRKILNDTIMKPGENCTLYCMRLDVIAKRAYPGHPR